MNNVKIIEFFPLQKIEVIESKKTYKPGSLGYVVRIGRSPSTTKPVTVMFMRFGKKGKKRVTSDTLFYQSIDVTALKEEDTKILKDVGIIDLHHITVKLMPVIQETKNLEDMTGDEFVCYIAAFSYYLCHLDAMGNAIRGFRAPHYPHKYSILDTLQFIATLDQIGAGIATTTLHNIITSASTIGKIADGVNLLKEIVAFYETLANRSICMEALYKDLSAHRNAVEQSQMNMINNNLKTIETIKEILRRAHGGKKQAERPKKAQEKTMNEWVRMERG